MPSLNFGDGVWLQVRRDLPWDRPARSDATFAALATGRTARADSRPPVMDSVDRPPPIASLITVGTPAPDGATTVSGAPGAVPPGARVLVASLAYSAPRFVRADQDGSFDTAIPAAPGDTIQIRYLAELGNSFVPQDLAETVHWPGTLVRAPQSEPASDFEGASFHTVESGFVRGVASGTVSETRLAVGGSTRVAGTIAFRIPAGAVVPSVGSIGGELLVSPLFDAAGNQVGAGTDFISHLLTPTGLPIERSIRGGQGLGPLQVTSLERVGDLLTGSFDASGAIPAGLPDGTYLLFVGFGLPPRVQRAGIPPPGQRHCAHPTHGRRRLGGHRHRGRPRPASPGPHAADQ